MNTFIIDKVYLGDSVYAHSDGFHVVLTTENGFGPNNTIYLDDTVFANLLEFAKRLREPETKSDVE